MMRILLSAYACRPNAGSEPSSGWNWATHLAARGIDVHVLTAQHNQKSIEAGLLKKATPNLRFSFVRVPGNLANISLKLHYVCWQIAALRAARTLIRKSKFDLAHHVTYGSVHVPSQLWRLGIPQVFGPVGGGQTAPAQLLSYFGRQKRREQFRTVMTRWLVASPFHRSWLRRMDFVLAANRDTLRIVDAVGCRQTGLMCDVGLPDDYFGAAPRNFQAEGARLKLLWVGSMVARKALPLALDAVKASHHPVTLTIAGDGSDPALVRRMIADRNLDGKVFWRGARLPWRELRLAYLEHDAMLFTSLRDSFGSQLLEAMGLGLPIITLDLHGAHDFVPSQASLKVPAGDVTRTVQNLADAIDAYASYHSERRNQMSKAAWTFARAFTCSSRAEFVEQIYKRILGQAVENAVLQPAAFPQTEPS